MLAEKYHQETIYLMKEKAGKLDGETREKILQSIEDSLMDGDFEALIEIPLEKGEFAKAFLIGEGFIIKEENWQDGETVFKIGY